MPVTKTAKRALRSSKRKEAINKKAKSNFEVVIRRAKKTKSLKDVSKAISLTDRVAKRNIIHKNKAARIKKFLSGMVDKNKQKKKSPKK